jgi:hypothetical protein
MHYPIVQVNVTETRTLRIQVDPDRNFNWSKKAITEMKSLKNEIIKDYQGQLINEAIVTSIKERINNALIDLINKDLIWIRHLIS